MTGDWRWPHVPLGALPRKGHAIALLCWPPPLSGTTLPSPPSRVWITQVRAARAEPSSVTELVTDVSTQSVVSMYSAEMLLFYDLFIESLIQKKKKEKKRKTATGESLVTQG